MNPKDKIKQLLGEAIVETDSSLDQRILADAWQGGRGRWKTRRAVVALATVIAIVIAVTLYVQPGPDVPEENERYIDVPVADRLTLGAINATYRKSGLEGFDYLFELAGKQSGPRPERLSVQSVLDDFDD